MKDKSFRAWFKLMWGDKRIQLFTIALILLIVELYYLNNIVDLLSEIWNADRLGFYFSLAVFLIPPTWISIIGYKGFYQQWQNYLNDYKPR